MAKAITVLELAIHRGAKADAEGGMSFAEIERVGLPGIGGCEVCEATIAAYNASPCRTGYLRCTNTCVGGQGFETVEEANAELFPAIEDDDVDIRGTTGYAEEYPEDDREYYGGDWDREDFCRGT